MSETTPLKPRDIDRGTRVKIKQMLRYGDVREIAERCSVTYNRVSQVMSNLEPHDEIWMKALTYFSELPGIEIDDRLYKLLVEENNKEVA